MMHVLSTTDRSLAESLRISLEAEGIAAVMSDDGTSALPFIPITVTVVDDADYGRAVAVLQSLQATSSGSWTGVALSPRLLRLLLLVVLALVAAICYEVILS